MTYVGTIPADAKAKDVVAYIKEAVTAGAYDDSDLKGKVATNTAAIETLNGTGDGSVKKLLLMLSLRSLTVLQKHMIL